MPTPLGPVIKAWQVTCGRGGPPHHLPGVVDAVQPERADDVTVTSTQRPEIGHSFAIGVYDLCMFRLCGDGGHKTKPDTSGLRPGSSFGF